MPVSKNTTILTNMRMSASGGSGVTVTRQKSEQNAQSIEEKDKEFSKRIVVYRDNLITELKTLRSEFPSSIVSMYNFLKGSSAWTVDCDDYCTHMRLDKLILKFLMKL